MSNTWRYYGYNVYRASINSSGIRWYAMLGSGVIAKADTKENMRLLIRKQILNPRPCRTKG